MAGGELVKVAWAADPVEAEMIRGMLESAGIPSFLQATGVDGRPIGSGAPGPSRQRVMVHAERAEVARRLIDAGLEEGTREPGDGTPGEPGGGMALARWRGEGRLGGALGAGVRATIFAVVAMTLAYAIFQLVRLL